MASATPDWNLPTGVDRGLHDYFQAREMVDGYDAAMAESPLATADMAFCEQSFPVPGALIDLGCGTGRLARPFAEKEFDYLGVDLSTEMLSRASINHPPSHSGSIRFQAENLVDLDGIPSHAFAYAACLFSTWGMIRGDENRRTALRSFHRVLKPGGILVLHVHNRYFLRGLGLKGIRNGDVTMTQAYGGAALTLRHFGKRETVRRLTETGFHVLNVLPVTTQGRLPHAWWLPALRAYGYLFAAKAI